MERVVIVGGVAGGMSAATRLRRLDERVEIVVLERSGHVSFANCGLPYFVGGVIEREDDLTILDPEELAARFRLDVRASSEVMSIDLAATTVQVRDLVTAERYELAYDALVLSTGASPVRPPIPGYDRVQTLRTVEDAEILAAAVAEAERTAVVIGGGFIGLEVAENLAMRGLEVTVVEAADHVLPPLDAEMAAYVRDELERQGVHVRTGVAVTALDADSVSLADGSVLAADLVVGAVGVRPDARLAATAGLAIGRSGGIVVDEFGRTSDEHVYAVGDVVEKTDAVSGAPSLIALANVANRQGRRVADHLCGRAVRSPVHSVGTAIVQVFDLVAGSLGWSEARLRAAGREVRVLHSHPFDHATYFPGAERLHMKLLFDPEDGAILGAQVVGGRGVDKRLDVLATAMSCGLTAPALANLELAYAPPFSSAKDPVNMLGYMAENVLSGDCDVVAVDELAGLRERGWHVLDVRTHLEHVAGSIPGSLNVPLDELRTRAQELPPGGVVVYCEVGQRAHTATALLHELGREARNLDGGYQTWLAVERARRASAATVA